MNEFWMKLKEVRWWGGPVLHSGVTLAVLLLAMYFNIPLGIMFGVAVVWWVFFWELRQHWPEWWEIFTHPQSLLEWLCPVLLALVMWMVF